MDSFILNEILLLCQIQHELIVAAHKGRSCLSIHRGSQIKISGSSVHCTHTSIGKQEAVLWLKRFLVAKNIYMSLSERSDLFK